jgi:ribonuclease-3
LIRRSDDIAALERAIGHTFEDRRLLSEALTHSSIPGELSNERLEFLGDRVLGLVIAEALVARYADESEGTLAPRLNGLVRRETLADVAKALDIGAHLKMAKSESRSGGRQKEGMLADAMEAIIAAVYLDAGLSAARDVILDGWRLHLDRQDEAPIDAKTALQEWAQGRGMPLPAYREVSRDGPDHNPNFTVEVSLGNGETARGSDSSKRAAQQAAAKALLSELETPA